MTDISYDYIIAGGGLAGLSLAYRLSRSSLRDKKVLIIDREEKSANDHTWCFWERCESHFEAAVFHRWKKLLVIGPEGEQVECDLGSEGFEYKMVRAADLYRFIRSELSEVSSFKFMRADIKDVSDGEVMTDRGRFSASGLVFDSVSLPAFDDPRSHNLLQHFLGWTIETTSPAFDPGAATLFDFRTSHRGECRFLYILPVSPDRALVEYTIFSKSTLSSDKYADALEEYLSGVSELGGYRRIETEKGVIPMSDVHCETRPSPKVVRIGTAGGYVKPSTGYSFSRTQARLAQIVEALETGQPVPDFRSSRARWKMFLDSTMLNILEKGDPPASEVFTRLFRTNPPGRILDFLDEKTSVAEDLAVMRTVPLIPFGRAALTEAFALMRKSRRGSNQ